MSVETVYRHFEYQGWEVYYPWGTEVGIPHLAGQAHYLYRSDKITRFTLGPGENFEMILKEMFLVVTGRTYVGCSYCLGMIIPHYGGTLAYAD